MTKALNCPIPTTAPLGNPIIFYRLRLFARSPVNFRLSGKPTNLNTTKFADLPKRLSTSLLYWPRFRRDLLSSAARRIDSGGRRNLPAGRLPSGDVGQNLHRRTFPTRSPGTPAKPCTVWLRREAERCQGGSFVKIEQRSGLYEYPLDALELTQHFSPWAGCQSEAATPARAA